MFLAALLPAALAATTSCVGEPELCQDTSWCDSARNCGAWRLREERGEAVDACRSIKSSSLQKLYRPQSEEEVCTSQDTTVHGFRCFNGDGWVRSIADFLVPDAAHEELDESLTLDKTRCEDLTVDGAQGGLLFMAGHCCAGWAVPCTKPDCVTGYEPNSPGILKSSVSIWLFICAAVHAISAAICIVFASRLLESYPSTEGMSDTDKEAGSHVIMLLGAAHGGFAAVLVFGALQDWMYGKFQVALVALLWYAVLGPLAEARQHGMKPWSQSHYMAEFIGLASGECLSKPPKINYILLCICMLIAIGVRGALPAFLPALPRAVGCGPAVLCRCCPVARAH